MYTKRIDIDGCTHLFSGELVRGSEHPTGGNWTNMDSSLRFTKVLSHEEVQVVLDNPSLFNSCNRCVVWRKEIITTVRKEVVMRLDYIANDQGDPSVGLFPSQTNVTVLIYPSDLSAIDEEVVDFWRQSVADFLDVPGRVQTVSEFNLEQEQMSKLES